MDKMEVEEMIIASADELEILFPNKIQRDIFISIICRVLNLVDDKTCLKGIMFNG